MSQVIKKRRIVLASVLKPVDDTRMAEKIGASLATSGAFEVSIIGYPSVQSTHHTGIEFHSLKPFKRFSLGRLLAPWRIFKKINQLKPEIVVINTPELLFVAILQRVFFERKIVYDVLENYYRNIRFTSSYPSAVRWLLAPLVRLAEDICSPFFHHHFLAEKGYASELPFAKHHTVLENKLPQSIAGLYNRTRSNSRLVFSGTLSHSTGVFDAIYLTKQLHQIDPSFSLTLVGHCAVSEVLNEIEKEIKGNDFITFVGGGNLVPHKQILNEINQADFGIIIYPPNLSTRSSMPTKLYEYLALKLPILISHNQESHDLVQNNEAGVVLSSPPDYQKLATELKSKKFNLAPAESIFWENEAEKLIISLKKL